LNPHILSDTGT